MTILLHPNQQSVSNYMKPVKTPKEVEQETQLTFKPKTLKSSEKMANRQSATGDHNIDLHLKSKVHEKKDIDSEEYWYARNKDECKFAPEIIKTDFKEAQKAGSLNQVKGMEKQLQRLAKAREEAEFKKRMTERSGFSATKGVDKARKQVTKQGDSPSQMSQSQSPTQKPVRKPYTGKIKERAPLHEPKRRVDP